MCLTRSGMQWDFEEIRSVNGNLRCILTRSERGDDRRVVLLRVRKLCITGLLHISKSAMKVTPKLQNADLLAFVQRANLKSPYLLSKSRTRMSGQLKRKVGPSRPHSSAVTTPMPVSLEPMLPTPAKLPFSDPEWLFEPKWDGYRALCFFKDGKVRFLSRNKRNLTGRFPELQEISKLIKAQTAIIDGEISSV